MKVALCDDSALFLQELEESLREIPFVHSISSFVTAEDLFRTVETGECFDAVLMDINLNSSETGIDAAGTIFSLSPRTRIIYVTGYTQQFVQQIFLNKSNLSGFLSKPLEKSLLLANLEKVRKDMEQSREEIIVQFGGTWVSIVSQDIIYVESRGHTAIIHTADGVWSTYEKLANILEKLPDSFVQCHKSYLVNMNHIQRLEVSEIHLKNSMSIPVSRARNHQTHQAYFSFMAKRF